MKSPPSRSRRKTGRPLSFDPEAALIPAMHLFWRHGYEATSLAELTHAMGVTPPSVYAVYGDKKGLFRAAVRRYLSRSKTPVEIIAQASTAKAAAQTLIEGAAVAYSGADTPPGCLLASAAIAVSAAADDVREELAAIRRDVETALRDKIERDIRIGAMPKGIDSDAIAAYVMTVIQGLSTLARDGASRSKLQRIAHLSMSAWPAGASADSCVTRENLAHANPRR